MKEEKEAYANSWDLNYPKKAADETFFAEGVFEKKASQKV